MQVCKREEVYYLLSRSHLEVFKKRNILLCAINPIYSKLWGQRRFFNFYVNKSDRINCCLEFEAKPYYSYILSKVNILVKQFYQKLFFKTFSNTNSVNNLLFIIFTSAFISDSYSNNSYQINSLKYFLLIAQFKLLSQVLLLSFNSSYRYQVRNYLYEIRDYFLNILPLLLVYLLLILINVYYSINFEANSFIETVTIIFGLITFYNSIENTFNYLIKKVNIFFF